MAAQGEQNALSVSEFNEFIASELKKYADAGSPDLSPSNPTKVPAFRISNVYNFESQAAWNSVEFNGGAFSLSFGNETLSGQEMHTDVSESVEDFKSMNTYPTGSKIARGIANYSKASTTVTKYQGLAKGAKPTQSSRVSELFTAVAYIDDLYQAIVTMRKTVGSELLKYLESNREVSKSSFCAYYKKTYGVAIEAGLPIVENFSVKPTSFSDPEEMASVRKYFTVSPSVKINSHIQTSTATGIIMDNPTARITVRFNNKDEYTRSQNNKFYDAVKINAGKAPADSVLMVKLADGTISEFNTHNCHRVLRTGTKITGDIYVRSISFTNMGISVGIEFSTCAVAIAQEGAYTKAKFNFLKKGIAGMDLSSASPADADQKTASSEEAQVVTPIDLGQHSELYEDQ